MWMYHLSAWVPWQDSGWLGKVCDNPESNASCSALKGIRENRDVAKEKPYAGKPFIELPPDALPHCLKEGAAFMSQEKIKPLYNHPHSFIWTNLKPTKMQLPAFSVPVVPFERMLKEFAPEIAGEWDLDVKMDREPTETKNYAFISSPKNQEELLEGFFNILQPQESLVFLYAKKVPLTEDSSRVLIGVGRITEIPGSMDWNGSDRGMRQVFWDRPISHSIRPDCKDGFLMPYHEIYRACEEADIDSARYVAKVPDGTGSDFLYRAGLVSSDSALAGLMALRDALQLAINELNIGGDWTHVLSWLEERIDECWFDRGPCPGLRAALAAAGVKASHAAALVIHHQTNGEDPWPYIEKVCIGKAPNQEITRYFRGMVGRRLAGYIENEPEKYRVLQLLSRFNLSKEQAKQWFGRDDATDAIENPYLLYIRTRGENEPIALKAIDRTLFGQRPKSGNDIGFSFKWLDPPNDEPDRIAALAVAALGEAADDGHTWLPEKAILERAIHLAEHNPPELRDGDMAFLSDVLPCFHRVGENGWQLDYLFDAEEAIRQEIKSRQGLTLTHEEFNASQLIDHAIGRPLEGERDAQARKEKADALEKVASRSIATLDGPAGCGKTTLIKALCSALANEGRIVCLAPTGKARVQIERGFSLFDGPRPDFKTVHSFLLHLGRYSFEPSRFDFSKTASLSREYQTVIIDEASMLDTEMLAAVLMACSQTKRIILVGDPRQLPPINPGRPFIDIIHHLLDFGENVAQLHTIMRTEAEDEAAFRFARLFDATEKTLDDSTWSWPDQGQAGNLTFDYWKTPEQLFEKVRDWIEKHLPQKDDIKKAFDEWLGAQPFYETHFFNRGAGRHAEKWQILTPRRSGSVGTDELNSYIKSQYRDHWLSYATSARSRKIPRPIGDMQVTYGDKVICNRNHQNKDFYPANNEALKFVANGEVGVAIGPRRTRNKKPPLSKLAVEFTSQAGIEYKFWTDESDLLELAYALTIHRTQGSQFNETLIIVPRTQFVGPEMLYTAITRTNGPVLLFIQEDPNTLLAASNPRRSQVGVRLTNLFTQSDARENDDGWFDANRIHQATDGTFVRSKSELVIANLLHQYQIPYEYEPSLELDGTKRRPDFLITQNNRIYYWEHLGMLNKAAYVRAWEEKESWYKDHGITEHSEGKQLIITRDGPDGNLDACEIQRKIENILK